MSKITEYAEEFNFLDDEDRLMHLIDLAKRPTNLPKELRSDNNLVNGCMSQIWVDVGLQDQIVSVYYDSDAMITKGITSVVADCFTGLDLADAKLLTKSDFEELGIKELLSAQRRNGLGSLIDTISRRVHNL